MNTLMRWESLILETAQSGGAIVFIKDRAPQDLSSWVEALVDSFSGEIPFVCRRVQDLSSGCFQTRCQDLIFLFAEQINLLPQLDSRLEGQRILLSESLDESLPVDFIWTEGSLTQWRKVLANIKARWGQISAISELEMSYEAPCLFLDRDDVVVKNVPYNKDPNQVELMPGIDALISRAHSEQYWVSLVTNQSGLGRGWVNWKEYRQVHQKMLELLAQKGCWLDECVWAGFYENDSVAVGNHFASLRKPRGGMFQLVNSKLKVNMAQSIMVGDSATDLIAAFGAGVGFLYLFSSEKIAKEMAKLISYQQQKSDFKYTVIKDFSEVVLRQ